jgi:AcrR family transcriptional regulator
MSRANGNIGAADASNPASAMVDAFPFPRPTEAIGWDLEANWGLTPARAGGSNAAIMAVSLSDERSQLVRQRILAGAVSTLRAGNGFTFATVAQAAGVPERTVYRYFPSREDLLHALYEWANTHMALGQTLPTDTAELARVVRRAFVGFDELAPVVHELLVAPEGKRARLRNKAARQRAALQLARSAAPKLDAVRSRRLAAVYQLLGSASTWQGLRDFWDMSGEEAGETVALAIELLSAGAQGRVPLRTSSKRARLARKEAS